MTRGRNLRHVIAVNRGIKFLNCEGAHLLPNYIVNRPQPAQQVEVLLNAKLG